MIEPIDAFPCACVGRRDREKQAADHCATSVFGNNTYVHEFVHDARHLLGFPCH